MDKILVSACLLGHKVRYDAKHKLTGLDIEAELVAFCPEVEGGLAVPRQAAEIIGGAGEAVFDGKARVINKSGQDVSEEFIKGAKKAVEFCKKHKINQAILAKNSPSCGVNKIYDGSFSRTLINGKGVTAELLAQNGIELAEL